MHPESSRFVKADNMVMCIEKGRLLLIEIGSFCKGGFLIRTRWVATIDFNERECVQTLYKYTSTTLFRVHREIKSPSFICKTTFKRKLYVWLNVYIYTKTTKSASQDLLFRHVQLNIVILLRVWTVKVLTVGSHKSRRRLYRTYFICLCFQIDTRLYDRADEFWLPVPIFGFRSLLAENHLGRGTLQDELVDKLALC